MPESKVEDFVNEAFRRMSVRLVARDVRDYNLVASDPSYPRRPPEQGCVASISHCLLSGDEVAQQGLNTPADLVADRADRLDTLPGRVVQDPVLVAFARVEGAGVAAAHGDHHI